MIKLASFELTTTASIDDCFNYVSDMSKFKEWFPEVVQVTEEKSGPIEVGKIYIEDFYNHKQGIDTISVEVKEFRPSTRFVTEADLKHILSRMEVDFSSLRNGETKIEWAFYSRNNSFLFKLVAPLVKREMKKRARSASSALNSNLKGIAETPEAIVS